MSLLSPHRRSRRLVALLAIAITFTLFLSHRLFPSSDPGASSTSTWSLFSSHRDWSRRREKYPVPAADMVRLPSGPPKRLPRIQHTFSSPDPKLHRLQQERRAVVLDAFKKSWAAYRKHAWRADEVRPVSLERSNSFAGWGATLVDSLDSLWIMGLKDEFHEAVQAVKGIDWSHSTGRACSLFETNIRFLGGLLSAYDLSQEQALLDKALELGHMLYAAFDTPQRLPVNAFVFEDAWEGTLDLSSREVSAAVGSMSLEFTRLAQLTGQTKFYDAIDRIKVHLNRTQMTSDLPGMWPITLNLRNGFHVMDYWFTLGAQADSLYEYLPKMYALLGGLDETYASMHVAAMETAKKHLLYRPMIPDEDVDILFTGDHRATIPASDVSVEPELQHLGCFAGGMYALGGRLLGLDDHVAIGARLARGCAWAYGATATGIMPEVATMVACTEPDLGKCAWNETTWESARKWRTQTVPKGFVYVMDSRYILRPEAIESVFLLYRMTGEAEWLDWAWKMFEAIKKATETEHAFSAIYNTMGPERVGNYANGMESFWLAETLKYFYLIFSDPEVISLDDWVFNTEAHPFKIPKPETGVV